MLTSSQALPAGRPTLTQLRHQLRQFPIGMGLWQLGGSHAPFGKANSWGPLSADEAEQLLRRAYAAGIRFFDTADVYGGGASEERLGQFLAGAAADDAVVCTKWGFRADAVQQATVRDYSISHLQRAQQASMGRLRRSHLNIVLLHNPPVEVVSDAALREFFDEQVAAGALGAFGISSPNLQVVEAACRHGFGSAMEVSYNAYDRRAERLCAAYPNTLWIGRSPLGSGFLSGRPRPAAALQSDDYRRGLPADDVAWRLQKAGELQHNLGPQVDLASTALRFALSYPALDTLLVGVKTLDQLAAALAAARAGVLPEATVQTVKQTIPRVFAGWEPPQAAVQTTLLQGDAGPTRWGAPEVLCGGEKNLIRKTRWQARGYQVHGLERAGYDPVAVQRSLSQVVAGRMRAVGLAVPVNFELATYHRTPGLTDELHRRIAKWAVDLNALAIDKRRLTDDISEAFGIPVRILVVRGKEGPENCGLRIVRPQTGDANPFHRDGWLDIYTHTANAWIPIVHCAPGSSLRVFEGSHLWPESHIERTYEGARIGKNRFHVPAAVRLHGAHAPVEPLPQVGECLLFSTYMLHGGAINQQADATRVSIEIRFIHRDAPEVSAL